MKRAGPGLRRREVVAGTLAVAAFPGQTKAAAETERPRFERDIVVDIHCHSFNATDLPMTGFLAHYIPLLPDVSRGLTPIPDRIIRKIVDKIRGWTNRAAPSAEADLPVLRAALENPDIIKGVEVPARLGEPLDVVATQVSALLRLDAGRVRALLRRVAETVFVVEHGRARVAATLATTYPTVELFTPLLVDYDEWSNDHPDAGSALAAQIPAQELVSRLSIKGRIGRPDARLHPFVAFDPLREVRRAKTAGALAMVRQAVEQAGFIGVKLYPPVGFAPLHNADTFADREIGRALDRALRALYAYCEAEEVPITAHASAANEYALGLHELASPDRWRPVLKEFPSLRLNFGHFGHDHGADPVRRVDGCKAWMQAAAALVEAYPNVYADLSNSPLVYDAEYGRRFVGYLRELQARFKKLPTRLMYGSDWWMNRFGAGSEVFVSEFHGKLTTWFGAGVRRDVMGRNALRFLGFLDQDNRPAVANRNRQRLRAFYGSEKFPDWLA